MLTLRRCEEDVDEPTTSAAGIAVSADSVYLFATKKQVVKVWWKVEEETSMLDWIGLFNCGVEQKNCKLKSVYVTSDDQDVLLPIPTDQPLSIPLPSHNLHVRLPNSAFRHLFSIHQLEDAVVLRSVDNPTANYQLDLHFSVVPDLEDAANAMKASTSAAAAIASSSKSNPSDVNQNPLPTGWQSCLDTKGRRFYVNHATKTTSWTAPTMTSPEPRASRPRISKNSALITPRRTTAYNDESDVANFIRRHDFVSLLHENTDALAVYNSSSLVRHAVHHVRQNLESPSKFENNPTFVGFINGFADESEPLPAGWTLLSTTPNVYVNHSTKRTTFFDPRVRVLHSQLPRRGFSAPPRHSQSTAKGERAQLLNKLEEIAQVADRKLPLIATRVRKKLRLVQRFGEIALASLANDLDLSLAISLLDVDDDDVARKQDATLNLFYAELQRARFGRGPGKLNWKFSRDSLLRDAFHQILAADVFSLRRSRLAISFDDENALDYGGPSREFFYLLSRELFDPKGGLFEYTESEYSLQLASRIDAPNKKRLELCGRLLALALIHRCFIDVFFTAPFYKMLLQQQIEIDDFALVDQAFHRSMLWILANPVEDLDMYFVADDHSEGASFEKELVEGGAELRVTEENKDEFVRLMCKWKAGKGVEESSTVLLSAFYQVIDKSIVGILSVDQLRVALSGNMELDLVDWRSNTSYKGGYFDGHVVIKWFWETVEQLSNAERLRLLLFVTGSSSVPFEGFAALRGTNGANKFCIERWGDDDALPRAHTCFNRLQLPSYATRQTLRKKLSLAVADGISYSIE
ncbi:unnamed protein product [Caenorhabditis auriculariae]|uniref:HECT-type E3 ubiquitin transferase n=1 Tax=Caenorhabditis auriculariae TaxID=2777116 RepID=A0A8S1GYL9_9PELO|nr:unnamed protein product [Caenorhabditis auriculariae]